MSIHGPVLGWGFWPVKFELVFGLWSGFISRSVHARLQVCAQRLRFVPPWLTSRFQTHAHTDSTLVSVWVAQTTGLKLHDTATTYLQVHSDMHTKTIDFWPSSNILTMNCVSLWIVHVYQFYCFFQFLYLILVIWYLYNNLRYATHLCSHIC